MPFLGANGLAGGPTSGPKYAPPKPAPAPSRPSGGMLSALPAAIAHALSRAAPALRHVAAAATHSSASAGHTATHAAHASTHASGRLAAAIAAGLQRDPNNPYGDPNNPFEVMRNVAELMGGDPFARYPYPAYPSPEIWNFSQPEYSPQGGIADPLPSLTGHLYDVLPAKAGTAAEGVGKRFGDFYVKPIPLANTNRPLAERQRSLGFGAHGLPGRQPPPGLAVGRRRPIPD